jgi:hypothetical protein
MRSVLACSLLHAEEMLSHNNYTHMRMLSKVANGRTCQQASPVKLASTSHLV